MRAILIHRCRLRLVRRRGWSWGPDPSALLQAALGALPALLASALAGLWPEEDEREIVAPVRLRVPLRVSELLAAGDGISGHEAPPPGSPAAEVAGRLASALAVALAQELPRAQDGGGPASLAEDSHGPAGPLAAGGELVTGPTAAADLSLGRLLRAWRDRGVLASRLALLSASALAAWVEILLREGGIAASVADEAAAGGHEVEARGLQPSRAAEDRAATALRVWLVNAVEVRVRGMEAGALPAAPGGGSRARDDSSAPLAAGAVADPGLGIPAAAPAEVPMAWGPKPGGPRPVLQPSWSRRPRLPRDAEIRVASALPFLLFGSLSRSGYLETLAATFAAADLQDDLPRFAAALALKALPPPEHGWSRTPAALAAAAACAGLVDAIAGEELFALARRARSCLEPLAADLADSLVAGHELGRPLFLAAAGDGLLLAEVDGVFPIAWAPGFAELSPVLARLRDQTLLVSVAAASPALLREVDASGLRFVTAAPPTRGEPWRPLRLRGGHGGDRVWTNDPAAPGLARQARGLALAEEGARRLWQALGVERPILPNAAGPDLDRHLTLAAGVALGTLAWTLWRDGELVDPVLALERFGDLDARVRFSDRAVRVVIPLGRRHQDLFAHGLLAPVRDAVWLGGRVLEFGGG